MFIHTLRLHSQFFHYSVFPVVSITFEQNVENCFCHIIYAWVCEGVWRALFGKIEDNSPDIPDILVAVIMFYSFSHMFYPHPLTASSF